MKILYLVLAFAAVLSLVLAFRLRSQTTKPQPKPPKEIYLALRSQALSYSREKLGFPSPATPSTPWGVVMDWGVPNGTATTVAFVDGSASIYTSAGGGYIGGQPKVAINRAAKAAVTISASCVPDSHATTTFPLPTAANVSFYLLTDQGVLSATRSVDELKAGSGPLFQLGNAMQEVNTQYRLLNDKN